MGIICASCGRDEKDDTALICSGCGVPFEKSGGATEGATEPEPAAASSEPREKSKTGKAKKKRAAGPAAAAPFCERCTAESSDESAGAVSEGYFFGRSFWLSSFGARPCDTCGSEVRTLWHVIVGIPLVPIASYRYKIAEGDIEHRRWQFHSRRLPQLESAQVRTTRVLSLLIVLIVAGIIYWKSR
jgi:hypothetical protein